MIVINFRQNFLKVDIYFGEIKYEEVTQLSTYGLTEFFSEFHLKDPFSFHCQFIVLMNTIKLILIYVCRWFRRIYGPSVRLQFYYRLWGVGSILLSWVEQCGDEKTSCIHVCKINPFSFRLNPCSRYHNTERSVKTIK